MNPDKRDQFAERWIEEVLARYSDAEPRPGLDSRILANLEAAERRQRRSWRLAWIPVACSALVILGLSIGFVRSGRTKPTAVSAPTARQAWARGDATVVRSTTPAQANVRQNILTRRDKTQTVAMRPPARGKQFPSPIPETEQERLLAQYISTTPSQEVLALLASQRERQEEVERRETEVNGRERVDPEERNDARPPVHFPLNSDPSALGAR